MNIKEQSPNGDILYRHKSRSLRVVLEAAATEGVDLTGAEFRPAWNSSEKAAARRKNLSGAKLSGIKAASSVFGLADLSGADLSGADLSYAGMCGCDLRGANLVNANLFAVCIDETTNFEGANLSGAWVGGRNAEIIKRSGGKNVNVKESLE
jgi:uncharacterized protein YjbI with pentapeptide repeats